MLNCFNLMALFSLVFLNRAQEVRLFDDLNHLSLRHLGFCFIHQIVNKVLYQINTLFKQVVIRVVHDIEFWK